MSFSLDRLCQETLRIVIDTGEFIRSQRGNVAAEAIEEKDLNSLVSFVDRQAESRLVEGLSRLLPGSTFLTEEDTVDNEDSAQQWIIDPLDGTTNFLHQLPVFSVSVALRLEGAIALGIVYEINQDESFFAWKGSGAFLNGDPIRASRTTALSRSLVATGFPYYDFDRMSSYLEILNHFMRNTRGIRRLGSAAVDLAYVACGRFDAFFEYSLNPWDVAAGAFIAQEAGARISDFRGGADFLFGREIIAAAPLLFSEVQQVVGKAFYPENGENGWNG